MPLAPLHLLAISGLVMSVPAGGEAISPLSLRTVDARSGRAVISAETPLVDSKVLVVVSSLARWDAHYPLTLHVRAAERPIPEGRLCTFAPKPVIDVVHEDRADFLLPVRDPDPTRTFSVLCKPGDPALATNYRKLTGRLRAFGHHVQIYVDDAAADCIAQSALNELVATFDGQIWPALTDWLGTPQDVDGDGRLTILITPRLTDLTDDPAGLDGLMRGADFDTRASSPFGNQSDVIFLNANVRDLAHLRSVLVHEYTHAVIFCQKVLRGHGAGSLSEEESWLDEAIAHVVEDRFGFSRSNVDYRVDAFLCDPGRFPLVVDDYYSNGLFRSHGHRGAAYLFLRWCVERFGPDLVPALVRSEHRGANCVEKVTGVPFEELYRHWSADVFLASIRPSEMEQHHAGPWYTPVTPGSAAVHWEAAGTTSRYFVIPASATGAVSIEVEGPPEAELQVSIVPLPHGMPRLEITPRLASGFLLAERDGVPLTVQAIEWRPLDAPRRPDQQRFWQRLDGQRLDSALGGSRRMPAFGRRLVDVALDTPSTTQSANRIIRVVGMDDSGRRVSAWCRIAD